MSAECVDLGALEGRVVLFGGPYSNLQATEALIAEAGRLGVDAGQAVCTGDLVAYFGDPAETVSAVREWGCTVIAGNCEIQLAEGAADCGCGFDEGTVCAALSDEWYAFAALRIGAADRAWMAAMPRRAVFTHAGRRYAVFHGGARDVSRFIWPGDRNAMTEEIGWLEAELGRLDGVVAGHSGVPFVEEVSGRLWINAGVIGAPPHDGGRDTRFAILEDGAPRIGHLRYDAVSAAAAMEARVSPYRDALTSGWWPSEDVLPQRLRRGSHAA